MMKKYLIILLALSFTLACSDLDRSNPLDPKNENSTRQQIVLVEGFVNSSAGDVIDVAVSGFEKIIENYNEQPFIFLEHHIERTQGTDQWATQSSLERYNDYVPNVNDQGIPDVFFNGTSQRVQGAMDEETIYQRYRSALEQELSQNIDFTIEADVQLHATRIAVEGTVARLGSSDATDLQVFVMVVYKVEGIRNVVGSIALAETIGKIESGKTDDFSINFDNYSGMEMHPIQDMSVVIVLQNSNTNYVLQNLMIPLKSVM